MEIEFWPLFYVTLKGLTTAIPKNNTYCVTAHFNVSHRLETLSENKVHRMFHPKGQKEQGCN